MDNNSRDQEIIKDVIAQYVTRWNERDLDAWGNLFTDDVDYINRGGGWWQSNADNIEGHRELFAGPGKDSPRTYRASVSKITFLKSDVALVHAQWEWPGVMQSSEKGQRFNGIMMILMVKQGGKWLIRALQNTVIHT